MLCALPHDTAWARKPFPGPKTRPPLPACRAAARRRTAVKPATTTKAKKTAPMVMPTESLVACAAIASALTWSWLTVGDETDCAGGGVGILIRAKDGAPDGASVGAPELVGAGAVCDAASAVGDLVGDEVGAVGDPVGVLLGHWLGGPVGDSVGPVGHFDGAAVGHSLGCAVGQSLGRAVGCAVGRIVVGHVAGGPAAGADPSDATRAAAATAHLTRARIAAGSSGAGPRSADQCLTTTRARCTGAPMHVCADASARLGRTTRNFLALLADQSTTPALSSTQETGPLPRAARSITRRPRLPALCLSPTQRARLVGALARPPRGARPSTGTAGAAIRSARAGNRCLRAASRPARSRRA
jgi:hypothetical protein